jgi:hypothetical protein
MKAMNLPPLIQIAIEEKLWSCESPQKLKDKIVSEGLDKECSRQARWSMETFEYADFQEGTSTGFGVTPTGSLNPFSVVGKCSGESCLAQSTNDFIKTVGLYTEFSILPDPISVYFLSTNLTAKNYLDLFLDLKTLEKVAPLIESNVLRLGRPVHDYCSECQVRVDAVIDEATQTLLSGSYDYSLKSLHSTHQGFQVQLHIPILQPSHEHPLTTFAEITKTEAALIQRHIGSSKTPKSKPTQKAIREIITRTVKDDLKSVFFDLELSRALGSLLLAGSRVETMAINALDKNSPSLTEIENWEKIRTVHLPWISYLTADEVLKLREEASTALPRLREQLKMKISDPSAQGEKSLIHSVNELRAQALEVESELDSLHLPRERNYRAGLAGLAMAFVVYGLATQTPAIMATSLAALLATLAHLRGAEREHDAAQTKLVSTPGYALLKAREILARRVNR